MLLANISMRDSSKKMVTFSRTKMRSRLSRFTENGGDDGREGHEARCRRRQHDRDGAFPVRPPLAGLLRAIT